MFRFIVLGMNHQTASLEVRERVALSEIEVRELLERSKGHPGLETVAALSTCNRTELLAVPSERGNIPQDLLSLLGSLRPEAAQIPSTCWYLHRNEDAVRHLFRVCAGLDSMMVGEPQIPGQVKEAYKVYCDTCEPHPLFNKLFHLAFRCTKRIRTETRISEGAVSLAYAGVELALKIFSSLERKVALLIGAGETGELAARHLVEKQIGRLIISNRTAERALTLAQQLSGQVIPFEEMTRGLIEADVVLFCTETPEYLVTDPLMADVVARRSGRPLFLIDLGVPRNCDPACGRRNNVFLHDLDDLKRLAEINLARRKAEIPKGEAVIEEMLGEFLRWYNSLEVEPVIRELMERVEAIRCREIEKNRKRFEEEHWKDLDALTRGIIGKILHAPLERVKEQDGNISHRASRIEAMRDLFGLGDESGEDEDTDWDTG